MPSRISPLRYVLFRIEQVAPTSSTVLIEGETGAGKGGAAEILDLHPNTLRSRMKKLGIAASEVASKRP